MTFDLSKCPLCGQSNQCAMILNQPIEQCWCHQTSGKVNTKALEELPQDIVNQVCLCPSCLLKIESEDES